MKDGFISIDLEVEGVEDPFQNYVPETKKPDDICFWCHGPLEEEDLADKVAGYAKYYAKCKHCRCFEGDDGVWMIESSPVPILIDQPMMNGEYPTGSFKVITQHDAEKFTSIVTEGKMAVDDTVGEVMLRHSVYRILELWDNRGKS